MLCRQCEQTADGKVAMPDGSTLRGCTTVGVCGKEPTTAALQDTLVELLKGLSYYSHAARQLGAPESKEVNEFVLRAMFSTLTNVNFDAARFVEYIREAIRLRETVAKPALVKTGKGAGFLAAAPKSATYTPANYEIATLEADGRSMGIVSREGKLGPDVLGVQELITYGLKGAAAYATHALELGATSKDVYAGIQAPLAALADGFQGPAADLNELVKMTLGVGGTNLKVLELLDGAHTGTFGHPEPTMVNHAPTKGKAILISGHDLHDLESLLKQTEGKGVNVYTHGEMLPAHTYPGLKKYKHLVGHFGGPWQLQRFEFRKFPGAILMTTNCLTEPQKGYKDRLFTTNEVGWSGTHHVTNGDYSEVIKAALAAEGFAETLPKKELLAGFGHNTVLGVADKVLEAAGSGNLKRIFLIGGCDGSEGERSYFTKLAHELPKEALILTLGCGKFRMLGKEDYGNLPNTGIPRLLDMGQCNDSYSAIVVASKLAEALKTDVNGLPLNLVLSWFEQKAIAVLLTLLHLGVKNIRVGPNLPAFVTPTVFKVLQDNFALKGIDPNAAAADAAAMMQGK